MATSTTGDRANDELKQAKHHGGYQCNFVNTPPDHLQTECSICLCVLREPCLVDCCGYSFCKSCIEPIKVEGKPCPLCVVEFGTCIPDKRLQRTLNDLTVYCTNNEGGCEWVGRLSELTQHLNLELSEGHGRLSGCQFASIGCTHCGESMQRQDVKDHENDRCPRRPCTCEYCNVYKSTYEDVTSKHWPMCLCRPVACPNNCGVSPKFELLSSHLKECPLEEIDCTFHFAGCNEKLPRKDMPDHTTQSLVIHMSLLATNHQLEVKKLNDRISELEELYERSRTEVSELQEVNEMLLKQLEQNREKIREVQVEYRAIHNHVGLVPFTLTMHEFEEKRKKNISWYSPPFYSHPCGYKMCLRIMANGRSKGEKSHVSVDLYMMKGEYDEYLKWPFRGDIVILLLSQTNDEKHLTKILPMDDRATDIIAGRVITGERCPNGRGFTQFIHHRDLQPNFLKNNCLQLCVKEVILFSQTTT